MIDLNPETTQLETLDFDISYLAVGMEVVDADGWVGKIVEIIDAHSVSVHLYDGEELVGATMACCVPGCPMHQPCFPLNP